MDRAFLDCVVDRKVSDITSEAILSPSERYQNIQDNPEYNSVLPFHDNPENVCREYVEWTYQKLMTVFHMNY